MPTKGKPGVVEAAPILQAQLRANPALAQMVDDQMVEMDIAQLVYDLRTSRKLSQKKLAELVGTTQPVISRLESADYQGHSLSLLRRIAQALDCDLQLRVVPHTPPK